MLGASTIGCASDIATQLYWASPSLGGEYNITPSHSEEYHFAKRSEAKYHSERSEEYHYLDNYIRLTSSYIGCASDITTQ